MNRATSELFCRSWAYQHIHWHPTRTAAVILAVALLFFGWLSGDYSPIEAVRK